MLFGDMIPLCAGYASEIELAPWPNPISHDRSSARRTQLSPLRIRLLSQGFLELFAAAVAGRAGASTGGPLPRFLVARSPSLYVIQYNQRYKLHVN
jgi:hypothetical protein